jgi:predicted ribosome quality control (RQC) complex YloA/Tae2 family protein
MIKFGKNATHNWKLFNEASPNDTLFHLDKFPSGFVIINKPIEELTDEQVIECARLCKNNTKYRNFPKISVFYTSISNLRKGDFVGSLTLISNKKKKYIHI